MDYNGANVVPNCSCGRGRMVLRCAGADATYTGRYFYKCPANEKHRGWFLWCDEYHHMETPGMIPDYVRNQQVVVRSQSVHDTQSAESQALPSATVAPGESSRSRNDLEFQLAFISISLVMFMLGVIFGKLM